MNFSCRVACTVAVHTFTRSDNRTVNVLTYLREERVTFAAFLLALFSFKIQNSCLHMRIYNRSIMKSNIKKFKMLSQEKLPMIEANCWSILKRQAAEFCRETGLHGYRYISQTQRTKMERYVIAFLILI